MLDVHAEASGSEEVVVSPRILAVVRDVLDMKRMSLPVVRELAHSAKTNSLGDGVRTALGHQLSDEHKHIALCVALLNRSSHLQDPPSARHVEQFSRAMSANAVVTRPRLLCLATILCTAIETAAFDLLAVNATEPHSRELFRLLAKDEAAHFQLVAGVLATSLFRDASRRDRLKAYRLVLVLGWIAMTSWWPRLVTVYREAGLDVRRFVVALSGELSPALGRCGLWFPRRSFEILALSWLTVSDWIGRRKEAPGRAFAHDHTAF